MHTYLQNFILLDYHLVKSNSLFSSEKLKSREHYRIINSSRSNKPTSQIYFQKNDFSKELDWRVIYTLPQKVTTNTYLRSFQYKILNIISYLNEKLLSLGFLQHHFVSSAILLVKLSDIFSVIVQKPKVFGKNYS